MVPGMEVTDTDAIRAEALAEGRRIPTALVELPGPLDLPASLEPLRRSGDDLLNRWDGVWLLRTVMTPGGPLAYAATPVGSVEQPGVRLEVAEVAHLGPAIAAAGDLIVGAPQKALDALIAADPVIATLDRRHRGVRLLRSPDLFEALVGAISAQQVNLRWAATTRRRLAELAGTCHRVGDREVWSLEAAGVAGRTVAELRGLQFTTRKAEYILGAAEAIAGGDLDLASLQTLDDEAVIARLTALRGVGRWTAELLLARTLGRPAVVAGDLAVRKVVGMAYAGLPTVAEAEVRRLTAHWGAAAPVAQWLLLHSWSLGEDLVAIAAGARAGTPA